jgi:HAD superfamily hydrolase (TIGR01490 family)
MNLALFDFDGTVTRSDTWTPFMRLAVRPARLLLGQVLLAPMVLAYRAGIVSASKARQAAARVGFYGENAAALRELGAGYAATVLPGTIRPAALDRIEWHRRQGDEVVIVSASLDVYIRPWCEAQGLDYICTTLEEHGGRLTGRYVDGDCAGAEKARRIQLRYELSRYPVIFGYGDSGEDRPMLDLAHKKYYRWKEIGTWNSPF